MKNFIIIIILLFSTKFLYSQENKKETSPKLVKKEVNIKKQEKTNIKKQKIIKTPLFRSVSGDNKPQRSDSSKKKQPKVSPLMRSKNN